MNTDGESPQANMDGSQSKQLSNISVHPEAVRPIPIRLVPIRLPHRPLPRRIPLRPLRKPHRPAGSRREGQTRSDSKRGSARKTQAKSNLNRSVHASLKTKS